MTLPYIKRKSEANFYAEHIQLSETVHQLEKTMEEMERMLKEIKEKLLKISESS